MAFSWDKLKKEIKIDNCSEAMMEHADLYLKYAHMYAEAAPKKDEKKWQAEKTFAIIREGIRREHDKITEARLDSMTVSHPEYMLAKDEYLKASEEEAGLKLALQALSIRKDMLISLSANMREEAYQGISTGVPIKDKTSEALEALKISFSTKFKNEDE